MHMSSILGGIKLEQLKEKKKKKRNRKRKEEKGKGKRKGRRKKEGKRREKKEKNLWACVGTTTNTQNFAYQHRISFYCLERLFQCG